MQELDRCAFLGAAVLGYGADVPWDENMRARSEKWLALRRSTVPPVAGMLRGSREMGGSINESHIIAPSKPDHKNFCFDAIQFSYLNHLAVDRPGRVVDAGGCPG